METIETVTIPKDEYIDLLRCKSSQMEKALASVEMATLPPRKPHSWMNQAEKTEIRRMTALGFRPGEIAEQIGRRASTVSRYINGKRHAKTEQSFWPAARLEPCTHQRNSGA